MHEVRVRSWSELQERLYDQTWQEDLHRFRGTFAYRGLADVSEALLSSLMRLDPDGEIETHLLRNFRKYAHRDAVPGDNVWNWLALAQHHGLPTRLLDWTFSPLVAAHFVTALTDRSNRDGVIWRVDFAQVHEQAPRALRGVLEAEDAGVFTAEMLAEAAPTLADLAGLAESPFPLFFEPPSLDDRIVAQYALFSLMSQPSAPFEDWLRNNPDTCLRIVIPADVKWEVRDKLDQAGITERLLFPGLDGLSRYLARYYTRRAANG